MPETKRPRQEGGFVSKDFSLVPEDVVAETSRKLTINLVKVQLLFPAHVIYAGAVSGKRYDFKEPGSVLEVDSRDVPAMLAYRIGTTGCCGGSDPSGNQVFQTI